jgi:hypothetical protein
MIRIYNNNAEPDLFEVGPVSKSMSYDEAILYCRFLDYNGHRDWRMPTIPEARLIGSLGWGQDDHDMEFASNLTVTPVRDKV